MKPAAETLEQAFHRIQRNLRAYLRRRLPDPALADDLLHDVFLKAITSLRTGRHIENLTGWLYAAARTAVVDYYRTRGIVTEEFANDLIQDDASDDLQLHTELSYCLRSLIEKLPALYKETLIATELEGKTMRWLAEDQGVSVSAIKSRVSRGKSMLKEKFLACCDIEVTGGLVSDYHLRSASDGAEKCA